MLPTNRFRSAVFFLRLDLKLQTVDLPLQAFDCAFQSAPGTLARMAFLFHLNTSCPSLLLQIAPNGNGSRQGHRCPRCGGNTFLPSGLCS